MSLLLTGGAVYWKGRFENRDLCVEQGRIVSVPQEELRYGGGRRGRVHGGVRHAQRESGTG